MAGRLRKAAVLAVVALLTACGDAPAPTTDAFPVPAWAKVAPEQIAEAKKHGVPVAFENGIGMRFVLIPAGTFLMGSPEDEEGRDDDETQHEVAITRPFYISIHETTLGQFHRLRPKHENRIQFATEKVKGRSGWYTLRWDAADDPVFNVVGDDATAFATWLSSRDGDHEYRLPTESEWEYACRARTTTAFYTGHGIEESDAAFSYFSSSGRKVPVHMRSDLTVGLRAPNPWGAHDMHGGASEWCTDWWGEYPSGGVRDPHGPPDGKWRVVRGGDMLTGADEIRSASRASLLPDRDMNLDMVGFRLVSPLPEKGE